MSWRKIGLSDNALWVRQALEKLDAGEREILMLREYEQLNYAEIARIAAAACEYSAIAIIPVAHGTEEFSGTKAKGAKQNARARLRARRNHEQEQSSH